MHTISSACDLNWSFMAACWFRTATFRNSDDFSRVTMAASFLLLSSSSVRTACSKVNFSATLPSNFSFMSSSLDFRAEMVTLFVSSSAVFNCKYEAWVLIWYVKDAFKWYSPLYSFSKFPSLVGMQTGSHWPETIHFSDDSVPFQRLRAYISR